MSSTYELFRKMTIVFLLVLVVLTFLDYTSQGNGRTRYIPSGIQRYWGGGQCQEESKVTHHSYCRNVTCTPVLGWILNFNYEPHPEVVKILLKYYAKHFVMVVIVSPTGRIGKLLEVDTSGTDAEVAWAPPCDNKLHGAVAGVMMRCYATGLQILQASANFEKVDYVVLSNDDVILNMTMVREFAREGRPVSHASPSVDAPPMFALPPQAVNGTVPYFKGWGYAPWWPECHKRFSKVPQEYKDKFLEKRGDNALNGGVDVFFLPPEVVSEFIFLSTIVSECWLEMGIPIALAMLSNPVRFYTPPSEIFMYRWWGILIKPKIFENQIRNRSIVSFHPFKLSYPEHRTAFVRYMTKYKFNQ